jgi:tRNA (guanine10-N2)-dimethyltransferase
LSRDECVKEYFVIISGENVELGKAELRALLPIVCDEYDILWDNKLAIIKTNSDPIEFILNRAALIKEAGPIILDTHSSSDVINNISDDTIESVVKPGESFCIRTRSYNNQKDMQYRERLVVNLGEKIRTRKGVRVSMNNPDVTILVVLTPERTFVCKSIKSGLRKRLSERAPGRKEFFHPSMMSIQLARVMCNLGRIMPGEIVFDPFCGGGGILCEIASVGAIPVGMDLNWRLLSGANLNIASMGNIEYNLIQGDVQCCPISECNHIITDPPYGRASSTRGSDPKQLVEKLFIQSQSLVQSPGSVCICASTEMQIPRILNNIGLKAEFNIRVRVHRSLTREVIAFNL